MYILVQYKGKSVLKINASSRKCNFTTPLNQNTTQDDSILNQYFATTLFT